MLSGGVHVGSIAGVRIALHWSLLVVFSLVVLGLGAGVFPTWHPDWSTALSWLIALAAAVLLFMSVLAHELSHAIVGRAHGIEIRRITLFVFGGRAQIETEPRTWRSELRMAIAGPITSLAIGAACLAAVWLAADPFRVRSDPFDVSMTALGPTATVLLWLGPVNVVIALFNLVPAFPLDGGRVLRAGLWAVTGDIHRATHWTTALSQFFGWILIASGFAIIVGVRVPLFGSNALGGTWLALIGWFLNDAAVRGYRQSLSQRRLVPPAAERRGGRPRIRRRPALRPAGRSERSYRVPARSRRRSVRHALPRSAERS